MPSGEWEVVTDKGNVVCEMVVNAAGCYARQVAKWVGADLPICNIEHQYIVTGPVQEFLDRDEEVPVVRDPHASSYIRQEQKAAVIGIYEHVDLGQRTVRGQPGSPDAVAGAGDGPHADRAGGRHQTRL
jgi:dimethylglycine dehydrogenase